MIYFGDNETKDGNVLIINAHLDSNSDDSETFTSALHEKFEKWGTVTIFNAQQRQPACVTIIDMDPAQSTNSEWIDDFTDFSSDTHTAFTVEWFPLVNADEDSFLCDIVNGKIVQLNGFPV